jgi:ketosteroid isomerase-like protein
VNNNKNAAILALNKFFAKLFPCRDSFPEKIPRCWLQYKISNSKGEKIMKKILAITTVILILAAAALAQESRDEREVLKVNQAYDEAVLKKDAEALEKLLADDYVMTSPTGAVLSKAQKMERFRTRDIQWEFGRSEDVKVRVIGDAAIVTARFVSKGVSRGNPFDDSERYLCVYQRKNGRWLAITEQITSVEK